MKPVLILVFLMTLAPLATQARAETGADACAGANQPCLLDLLETGTVAIPEDSWRDSTFRELAKLLAKTGQTDRAIALIAKIKTPDTQAMTVRGIGMAAAPLNWPRAQYDSLFARLAAAATTITDPPSHDIAVNYIADAQAVSGDDAGAYKTATGLKNAEMRNKALYDCSKTQAEKNRIDAALAGIAAIDDSGFRDKAFRTASKIRADAKDYDGALMFAGKIANAYQKAQAILYILVRQLSPEEVSVQ